MDGTTLEATRQVEGRPDAEQEAVSLITVGEIIPSPGDLPEHCSSIRQWMDASVVKLPLGVDVATIVPLKRQLKQEFRVRDPWRHRSVSDLPRRQARNPDGDGDLNAVLVEWVAD